ncbi:MAG: 16S rRNA processing protein RimM [Muribaculaceae bacterium]|nr:16S rRNA processing protein RimM [Muribaculaceae bacterium]
MITIESVSQIGRFNKPHGIKGEISATFDIDFDISSLRCIIMDVDGILVPFFISGIRPKSADTLLITIDGVSDETMAQDFSNKPIYALKSDLNVNESDEDGFYASDFIGFDVIDGDSGTKLGTIADIEDSTQNMLFILDTPNNDTLYIPIVDEFITDIDINDKKITMTLPEGMSDL